MSRWQGNPKRLRFSFEPMVSPDKHSDPYMEAGSHPEIVERVWDALGSSLPVDCRAIVYSAPALVLLAILLYDQYQISSAAYDR
ncbi:hypothetical protein ACFL0M_14660 [Thermodesulfobacteriota bacterium]